mmetsp:Transcript_43141/g.119328  ORF Transcript_43141/g.119328 Transcript_43141/m.119328 type:complete len:204 (-) Transcript_43141:79-690(-)
MLTLDLFGHVVLRPPAPTMATNVDAVAVLPHVGSRLGQHIERSGASVHCARQVSCLEHLHDAPEAHAATILEQGLGTHVPRPRAKRARPVRQNDFCDVVAVMERGLGALLKVDHQIDGELSALWPFRVRVFPRVTFKVPRRPSDIRRRRRRQTSESVAALSSLHGQSFGKCALHELTRPGRVSHGASVGGERQRLRGTELGQH